MADGPFRSFDISASALSAERMRMNVIATNIANAGVLKTAEGGPYQRREVIFESILNNTIGSERSGLGTEVKAKIRVDSSPGEKRHDPTNPLADASGDVHMSNVSPTVEMVDLMTSARAYEANLAAMKIYREMIQRTLQLGR